MTTGTPAAPAGLALASYERPAGVNPPLDHLQGDQETVFFDV